MEKLKVIHVNKVKSHSRQHVHKYLLNDKILKVESEDYNNNIISFMEILEDYCLNL